MSFTNGRDKRSIAIRIITASSSARRSGVGIREAQQLLESETSANNLILIDGPQNYGLQPTPKAVSPGKGLKFGRFLCALAFKLHHEPFIRFGQRCNPIFQDTSDKSAFCQLFCYCCAFVLVSIDLKPASRADEDCSSTRSLWCVSKIVSVGWVMLRMK